MFDVGFLELLMIALVALIVIGPERLPRVARTVGLWVGRARRAFTSVKDEIDRELRAEELKQIMRGHADGKALERILEPEEKSASREDEAEKPKTGERRDERPTPPAETASRGDPP